MNFGRHCDLSQKKNLSSQEKVLSLLPLQAVLFFTFSLGMLFLSAVALGDSKSTTYSPELTLEELEVKIESANAEELHKLEIQATRNIQLSPESTFSHYLLASIYIRSFSFSPTS